MNPRTRIQQYEDLKHLRRRGVVPIEAQAVLGDERFSVLGVRALADRIFEMRQRRKLGCIVQTGRYRARPRLS
jgi:hypothetical protein